MRRRWALVQRYGASRMSALHALTPPLLARSNVVRTAAQLRAQALRATTAAWQHAHRRRALTALSCVVMFAVVAIPLATDVAHSEPKIEPLAAVADSAPALLKTVQAPARESATGPGHKTTDPLGAWPSPPGSFVGQFSTAKFSAPGAALSAGQAAPAPLLMQAAPVAPSGATARMDRPPATPTKRSRAVVDMTLISDVSTMDLMMPIAEPDLDIASRQSLWAQVGKQSGVDPLLLYSIALVESKSLHPGGQLAPTPWLFRVNDRLVTGERHHVQMQMAMAGQLNSAVQDVGIMQVYYPMHRDAVRDPLTLLDPRTNITIAAKILHDGMHQTRDPVLGVGYYHSHTPSLALDYGTAVMIVYQRLKGIYRPGRSTQAVVRSDARAL